MGDNLLVGSHKYTSETYRNNYDSIFRRTKTFGEVLTENEMTFREWAKHYYADKDKQEEESR